MLKFAFSVSVLISQITYLNSQTTTTPLKGLNPNFNCPVWKLMPWTSLTDEQRAAAVILHYNQTTWSQTMGNKLEKNPYNMLMANEKEAATFLGYVDDCWNCDINKYEGAYWSEIQSWGKEQAFNALGWTRHNWELGHDYPKTWTGNVKWNLLTEEQRMGAAQICYNQQSWDNFIP